MRLQKRAAARKFKDVREVVEFLALKKP